MPPRHRAVRRPAAGLLRRAREARGRACPFLENVTRGRGIPRERLEEVGEHYFAVRRPQPDQRPEPRVHRRGRGGLPRPAGSTSGLLGQPQLGPLPRRHAAADAGRRRRAGRLPGDQRLLVVLRLPAVPREPRRRGGRGRRRARPGSTGSGTTSTTPASWSRWSTRRWPRSPSSATPPATTRTCCSSPTRSRCR